MTTYDGGLGTTVTVNASDSTSNTDFNTEVALIGTNENGSISPNDPQSLESAEQAATLFGDNSDVPAAYELATRNGSPTPLAVAVDSASPDYAAAVQAVASDARYVVPLTTESSNIQGALTGATDSADDFAFTRVVAPGPDTSPGSVTTLPNNDPRLVVVSPQNATVNGTQSYTAVAVASVASRQRLGNSITYNEVEFDGVSQEYGRSTAQQFTDVTAVTQGGVIAEGVTTSEKDAFKDIYAVEIVDAVVGALDALAQRFAGESPNTPGQRRSLESEVDGLLGPLTQRRPPLLSTVEGGPAFERSVDAVSPQKARLNVAISPVDVMKQIDIALDVGSVVSPVAVQG